MHLITWLREYPAVSRICLIIIVKALLFPAAAAGGQATQTTITLNWTAPGDDSTSGTATQFDIRYSTAPITTSTFNTAQTVTGEPAPSLAGSPDSCTVTGLTPGTTYYFAMKTADEVPNWSDLSNVVSIATLPEDEAPSVIANLQVTAVDSASASLSWTAPGDDSTSGTAATYDIRYSPTVITDANWNAAIQADGEPSPQVAGSTETFTITGLSPGQTYYFAIKTADEVPNWSALSNIVSATTDSPDTTPPAAITDLSWLPDPRQHLSLF